MDLTRLTAPQRLSLASILVVVLAAFLPWVSLFGISARGIEGDGQITLALAVAGALVLVLTSSVRDAARVTPGWAKITLIVLAGLVALIGIVDMNGAAAIGLYLTLLAGVTWLGGAVWDLVSGRASEGTTAA